MIIADTSFLLAYFNVRDSQHIKAVRDIIEIREKKEVVQINNLVIQELLTLHNIKFKQNTSLPYFCSGVIDGHDQTMVFKKPKHNTWEKVYRHILTKESIGLSFVDLSLVEDVKSFKTAKLLTYDRMLQKYARKQRIGLLN